MLNALFKTTVYVKISPNLISAKHVETGKVFEDKPVIALKKKPNGKYIVKEFGLSAEDLNSEPDIFIKNGFNHPRVCIDDFGIAQTTLRYVITKAVNRKIFLRPILILHILGNLEGGLSQIENRALQELAASTGAREAFIWTGKDLSDKELLNLDFA